jgi:hypothetical protein
LPLGVVVLMFSVSEMQLDAALIEQNRRVISSRRDSSE